VKAVLLAGGRGTRMGSLTDETPKPLLQVGGRLLIERAIEKLARAGISDVIISTGYRAEQFDDALGDGSQWGVHFSYSVEPSPLGTGGAMALAARSFTGLNEDIVVVNADLISDHDVHAQIAHHQLHQADVTLHVRHVDDPRRYGVVEFAHDGRVVSFTEKPDVAQPAWINAGTYIVRSDILLELPEDTPMSWERDIMPRLLTQRRSVFAFPQEGYFRDVGTPGDLSAAESDGR